MWRGIVFHTEGPSPGKDLSPFCVTHNRVRFVSLGGVFIF